MATLGVATRILNIYLFFKLAKLFSVNILFKVNQNSKLTGIHSEVLGIVHNLFESVVRNKNRTYFIMKPLQITVNFIYLLFIFA